MIDLGDRERLQCSEPGEHRLQELWLLGRAVNEDEGIVAELSAKAKRQWSRPTSGSGA